MLLSAHKSRVCLNETKPIKTSVYAGKVFMEFPALEKLLARYMLEGAGFRFLRGMPSKLLTKLLV